MQVKQREAAAAREGARRRHAAISRAAVLPGARRAVPAPPAMQIGWMS
jgi:hypothetical protein